MSDSRSDKLVDLTPAGRSRRDSALWMPVGGQIALGLLWLLSRWIFDGCRQLVPDEAYYWVWSRHPALSYFDHPPMVAWMIRMGVAVMGDTELGVRWIAAGFTGGAVLLMAWIAHRLIRDWRAAAFVSVALLFSPLIAVNGSIITPDVPAMFFQAAALVCAISVFQGGKSGEASGRAWMLFGVFLGLALLSKYTAVLLGIAVLGALLSSEAGRRELKTIWPWLSAAVALAIFSPVILWNARHHWASFAFQLRHGISSSGGIPGRYFFEFLAGQIFIATPILFCLGIFVLGHYWRRRGNPMHVRLLLWSATTPLVVFALSSLRHRVEANWPTFAYLPMTVLIGIYLSEHWSRPRVLWAEWGVKVALVATLVIHVPEAFWAMNPKWSTPQWDEMFGWRELAHKVWDMSQDSILYTADYEYASELTFYLPGHYPAWPLINPGDRLTAYNFFPDFPKPTHVDHVLLVRGEKEGQPPRVQPVLRRNFTNVSVDEYRFYTHGRLIRSTLIWVGQKKVASTMPGVAPSILPQEHLPLENH